MAIEFDGWEWESSEADPMPMLWLNARYGNVDVRIPIPATALSTDSPAEEAIEAAQASERLARALLDYAQILRSR